MEKHVPAEWAKKVIHASMSLGDGMLMGADSPPDRYEAPKGFTVTIGLSDEAEAERIFAALSENGKVDMPLQKTYLGDSLWHADGPLRNPVDDQLRRLGGLIEALFPVGPRLPAAVNP